MSDRKSLQALLDCHREGDETAARKIYQLYEERLVRLADRRIGRRLRPHVQPESIMLLVLESALGGIAKGKYNVDLSGSLWNLLEKITDNKIRKKWTHFTAKKRDIRREVRPEDDDEKGVPEPAPCDPSPEEAVILADQLEKIRSRLKPSDFEILELQLQGYSHPQIAKQLGCARQTVRYKAKRIEQLLRNWADV